MTQLRVDVHITSQLLHDAVHGREAEPRPLSRAFGRIERLEKTLLHFFRHAAPSVRHGEHHVTTRSGTQMAFTMRIGELRICGSDRDVASPRHRVTRVDREVDQHLLDLARIGVDEGQLRIQVCRE